MLRRVGPTLLVLAGLLAGLLLGELGARLFLDPPRYHNEPLEFDSELGFRGIPDFVHESVDLRGTFDFRLNAEGLRGREIPDRTGSLDAVLRVAFVGDSFLVGEAIREAELVTARTASLLAERGTPAHVYNLSASDYGTAQELLLLRRYGKRIAPEVVVLALYPHNDVVNNFEDLAGATLVSPGDFIRPYLVPEDQRLEVRYLHPARARMRRLSRLFASAERRVLGLAAARGIPWLEPWKAPVPPLERLRAGRAPLASLELFRAHDPEPAWEGAWPRTFALLRAFRRECEAQGARLIVMVIPSLHQVVRTAETLPLDVMTRAIRGQPLDQWLDWNLPERRLSDFFEQEGIEAVLLLPSLREAAERDPDLYLKDGHLAPPGHALAASAVTRAIAGRAARAVIDGGPVPALPEASGAPRLLDLRRADHRRHLGANWVSWKPSLAAEIQGAQFGRRAYVALPEDSGDLVVRGLAPRRARYPIDLEIQIVGAHRQRHRIAKPGRFELRISRPAGRLPSADGYLALIFDPADGAPADAAGGPIVDQIGFATD